MSSSACSAVWVHDAHPYFRLTLLYDGPSTAFRVGTCSQDSFVNDGPISYETSSSQEDGAPGSRGGSQEGVNGVKGSGLDADGEGDGLQGKRGKRQEGGNKRIDDEDEKVNHEIVCRVESFDCRVGSYAVLGDADGALFRLIHAWTVEAGSSGRASPARCSMQPSDSAVADM